MSDETTGPGDQSGLPATTPHSGDSPLGAGTEGAADRTLQQAVRQDLDEVGRLADDQTEQAKTAVKRAAKDEKNLAARQLSGIAKAIEKVGTELEQSDQQDLGRYARQIGNSLQRFAQDVEHRELGEIAAMAEDFGRRQPLAFLGIAAIAGLAASRFLTASAQRHTRRRISQAYSPPSGSARLREGGSHSEEDRHNG
ncbi:nutrient deprivation-induced protein [Sinorhizobium numidicum]|uniref:Nutrient deprivation-induced protein n=1 Tax=Sinorhizobium numidicum TaxID=680248 RepID=A0ABY8CMM1_9HYPH|nr:nutrient deprivation-induced protein [Sinorhizobium numidicum]WEX73925.1 nutrient deprivation-induced protein [Sinorhizobium numidicum]WEX79910.1 nutrient deprivation-induced protein [Sinorhizobium numidicum]